MSTESIVILAAKRTPIGSFQGVLSAATASQLGGAAISGALVASGLAPEPIVPAESWATRGRSRPRSLR